MFGQLQVDCKQIGDNYCMLSIAVAFAVLGLTPELFPLPQGIFMPYNGSAVKKSSGLQGADLQILLLFLSPWQSPARKSHIWEVSQPKTSQAPSQVPVTDVNHICWDSGEWSPGWQARGRGRNFCIPHLHMPGAHSAALTSNWGERELAAALFKKRLLNTEFRRDSGLS